MQLSQFRLVIQARREPYGTYSYVIARRDEPASSTVGTAAFKSPDEAAAAGRLVIERLDRAALPQPPHHTTRPSWSDANCDALPRLGRISIAPA
jgi:hypothetical protein